MEEESWGGGAFGITGAGAKDTAAEEGPWGDHIPGKKEGQNTFFGNFLLDFVGEVGSAQHRPTGAKPKE